MSLHEDITRLCYLTGREPDYYDPEIDPDTGRPYPDQTLLHNAVADACDAIEAARGELARVHQERDDLELQRDRAEERAERAEARAREADVKWRKAEAAASLERTRAVELFHSFRLSEEDRRILQDAMTSATRWNLALAAWSVLAGAWILWSALR